MQSIVIAGFARSPFHFAKKGSLIDVRPDDLAAQTLYLRANSWYLSTPVPGKPRVFMPYIGGLPAYIAACEAVVKNDYEGFALA